MHRDERLARNKQEKMKGVCPLQGSVCHCERGRGDEKVERQSIIQGGKGNERRYKTNIVVFNTIFYNICSGVQSIEHPNVLCEKK